MTADSNASVTCPNCRGDGAVMSIAPDPHPCSRCEGAGRVPAEIVPSPQEDS